MLYELRVYRVYIKKRKCYWHECKPGEETDFEISEEQLRVDAQKALQGLYFSKRS